MSAQRKVIIIVVLGVSACLLSFALSQYYSSINQRNQMLLAQVGVLSGQVDQLRLRSRDFVRSGDENAWSKLLESLQRLGLNMKATSIRDGQLGRMLAELDTRVANYRALLTAIHNPAIEVARVKSEIKGLGLAFAHEVEDKIITPYIKEEGLRVYRGLGVDPIKSRIRDTAHQIKGLHLKQQLILAELLLDWDIQAYQVKKKTISQTAERQKAQLRYLSVLIGNQAGIAETVASLENKLDNLSAHEWMLLKHFSALIKLNEELKEAGDRLLATSAALTARIQGDLSDADRWNTAMSWALLITILAGLSVVGATLARDIIRFVRDLDTSREKFRASEQNLAVTLNSLGDAVIATDAGGLVTRMNPMAENLTGWSIDQAAGRPLTEVFHIINAQTRRSAPNPVEQVLAKGEIVGLANHTVLIARDGREYQIADSGAPIRHPDGEIIGVVLVFRDVTEAYAAEQKIRDSEKMLKNITDNIPVVVYQFKSGPGHEYSSTHVSGQSDKVFGMRSDEPDRFLQFSAGIPAEDKERFFRSIREATDLVRPWEYEGRFIKPSGEEIWFSAMASPQKVGDDVLFSGVLIDITDRHALAQALRIHKFSFDRAAVGIYYIGPDGTIIDANQSAAETLGYSLEELVTLSVFDLDTEMSRDSWEESWNRLRDAGADRYETAYRAKDGDIVPVEVISDLFKYEDQKLAIAVVQDITQRKAAEEHNRRLEESLAQAQKMEAIGTLAGGIAHDFNNILSAVIGYSEVSLTMIEVDNPVHQNLQKVLTAGLRARDLVQQILTFSRKHERKLVPLQMGPLVKESLKMLRSTLPATIDISQEIEDRLDNVMADATQVHQIVMNLCTNAAHAMEADGGTLHVALGHVRLSQEDTRLHPGLTPGEYLKLSIRDTGQGISPDNLKKIFDPYFTTKEQGKGTGLGLAVVHGIVKSYGGGVYAYSELGGGTTFKVYLPSVKDRGPEEKETLPDLPEGSEHILLVDDEPPLLEVGRLMLGKLGYRISTAGGGEAALELLRQDPGDIDLLVTDMTMPKMTGDKLASEFLKIRPDIPIILSTGYSVKMTSKKALDTGIKALISKPYVIADLARTVREVLDGNQPRA